MAYAYSMTYDGRTKKFETPPPGVLPDAIERAVALEFGLRIGSFGIKSRDGEVGLFHSGLKGDWDLLLVSGSAASSGSASASDSATGAVEYVVVRSEFCEGERRVTLPSGWPTMSVLDFKEHVVNTLGFKVASAQTSLVVHLRDFDFPATKGLTLQQAYVVSGRKITLMNHPSPAPTPEVSPRAPLGTMAAGAPGSGSLGDSVARRLARLERIAHKARLDRFETDPDTDDSTELRTEFPGADVVYATRRCTACGILATQFKCGRCKEARYCSLDCQRANWHLHKNVCAPRT